MKGAGAAKASRRMEIELKCRLPPSAVAPLLRHPALAAVARGRPRGQRLYSVYYDTPDLALSRHKLALRVRREGRRRWTQTVKAEGRVAGGLHQRSEWEAPVAGGLPDPTKVDAPQVKELLQAPQVRRRLTPVFVTDFRRQRVDLEFPDGTRAELAVDRGTIRAHGRTEAVTELEVELIEGSARTLFAFALELARALPIEVEVFSKAERGYRLAAGEGPPVVKARHPSLEPAMSVEEAFCHIVAGCVAQLQGNVEGMRRGEDVEHLHQMRVALRRARSALATFSRALPKPLTAPVRQALKWLTGELAPARDWDVFVTETLPPILAAFPDHAGLTALRDAAQRLRGEARIRAREATLGHRYRGLVLGVGAWLEARSWREGLDGSSRRRMAAPVVPFAQAVLARRHRQLLQRGRHHARLGADELHGLRILGKKLRYACEFFASLFPARATRPYLAALQALQDVLGAINDAATTERLMNEIAARVPDALVAEGIGVVSDWSARLAAQRRTELDDAWKRFAKREPFWDGR